MAYVFRSPDPEHGRLIHLLARSIRHHYPHAKIVLLTNENGRLSLTDESVEVRVAPSDDERVMTARMRAYSDYVRTVRPGTVIVLLDTDMLVVRRFDELMAPGADISVTVRPYPDMPINAGLLVVRTDDLPRMIDLFSRLHDCCASLTEDEQRWYGDQIALARLLPPPNIRLREPEIALCGEVRVRFAPGRVYNSTPRPWMLKLLCHRPGAHILHFKGHRKKSMALYAALHHGRLARLVGRKRS
ncbi:glycosyltransferase family protein [Aureimonas psammosilenae]|uniref:hypothetical protein n=1 Tax=Aureimonas psammosilenae TaxID=2495496 RepID=UPI0012605CEB|nr:hypothetical protein [Aureimonas psammosilenae]